MQEWNFEVQDGYSVLMNFDNFDVEYSSDCSKDYLELSDGHISVKLCGDCTIPLQEEPFHIPGPNVAVRVNTDGENPRTGFSVTWSEVETVYDENGSGYHDYGSGYHDNGSGYHDYGSGTGASSGGADASSSGADASSGTNGTSRKKRAASNSSVSSNETVTFWLGGLWKQNEMFSG